MGRLNVARLANVPGSVLQLAAVKSKELEEEAKQNGVRNLYVQTRRNRSVLIYAC